MRLSRNRLALESTARTMKAKGLLDELNAEITGLSVEQVRKLNV